jgi:hypothetical protein
MTRDTIKDQSDIIERQRLEILRLNNELKEAQAREKKVCEQLRKILEQ